VFRAVVAVAISTLSHILMSLEAISIDALAEVKDFPGN
jgi:hypothetical protein